MNSRAVLTAAAVAVLAAAFVLPPAAVAQDSPAVFFHESFDDDNLLARGWYDGSRFVISTDRPYAGAGCIEYGWTEKGGPQVVSSVARRLFEPSESVYLRYYIRLSSDWGWSGRGYHPHMTHFMTTENGRFHGPAASRLTLYIEPVAGRLRLAAQDIQNGASPHGLTQGPIRGGYNGKFYDSAEVLFIDDQWHCVEAYFRLNTVDLGNGAWNTDGVAQAWFDGRLVVDEDDLVFRTIDYPDMLFNQFLIAPYFGPGLVPRPQRLWIDELVVARERVSP